MRLWLRVDASREIGLGHVARSIAVAEAAYAVGHEARFLTHADSLAWTRLQEERWPVVNVSAQAESWLELLEPRDWVIFDGYQFTVDDHRTVEAAGAQVVAFDDGPGGKFDVDVLVNPSRLRRTHYELPAQAALLKGPGYACLRASFQALRQDHDQAAGLLITMGGSDPLGISAALLEWLEVTSHPFDRVTLLAGPGSSPPAHTGDFDVVIVNEPAHVAQLFASAQAAICPASTTAWELLCLGVPTAAVQLAHNQDGVAGVLEDTGAALVLPSPALLYQKLDWVLWSLSHPISRGELTNAARTLVDGRGSHRVVRELEKRQDTTGLAPRR